jgi:hypothetical protein
VDLVFIFVCSLVSSFFLGIVLFSDRMRIKMRDEHEISALVLIDLFNLPFSFNILAACMYSIFVSHSLRKKCIDRFGNLYGAQMFVRKSNNSL